MAHIIPLSLSVDLAMTQKANAKGKDEAKERDKEIFVLKRQLEKMTGQMSALQVMNEEKAMSVSTTKELVQALQSRLMEVEPELAQARDKIKDLDRHVGASVMLKAEQDALVSALRKDLKSSLDDREAHTSRIKELETSKSTSDSQLSQMAALRAEVEKQSSSVDAQAGLVTRLRAEAQSSERTHGMRTAMLATVEAQLAQLQAESKEKEGLAEGTSKLIEELQCSVAALEEQLAWSKVEKQSKTKEMEDALSEERRNNEASSNSKIAQHTEALETLMRDHAKKSNMARTLLSDRENDVRVLTASNNLLQEEISSGAPTDRKIFQLAERQANREATHNVHTDSRQIAFEQLQQSLAERDLELGNAHALLSEVSAEVTDLRRAHMREGINMDYLKNIVVQYMSFPVASSERMSLIPVIAMLLQFSSRELTDVHKANRDAVGGGGVMSMWGVSLNSPDALQSTKVRECVVFVAICALAVTASVGATQSYLNR
jgi:chromosome segregation ATPase